MPDMHCNFFILRYLRNGVTALTEVMGLLTGNYFATGKVRLKAVVQDKD
jgi:hypothetical protein